MSQPLDYPPQMVECSIPVAALASVIAGACAQTPRRYKYWRTWAARQFWFGTAGYLLAHAILGALVAGGGEAVDWEPFGSKWVLNGIVYAATAQGLIRIAPQGFSEKSKAAHSILSSAITFIVNGLNLACELAIEARIDTLSDKQHAAQAGYLYARYVGEDEQIPNETRSLILSQLKQATEKFKEEEGRREGRASLERFCLLEMTNRQLLPRAISDKQGTN